MPKMNITKRKQINAPVDKVFNILNSMKEWPKWSPWLIMDPATKVDTAADDKSYSWDGARTGSGHMKITQETRNQSIDYDLTFLKPWKSEAKVKFETIEKDGGTEVAWHMDSSLPWFMFWMKKMMMAFVGNDYERGLNLLKDYAEDGEVHSKLHWKGEHQFVGGDFLGIKRKCSIADMPTLMEKDFIKLMEYARENGGDVANAFNQYHKFDMVKQIVEYTAGVPFDKIPDDTPSEFIKGNLPATKLYTLQHTGPYDHLGNAWSTMYTMARNKEIKAKKGYHPFETYGNSPTNTDPQDLITYINFAVK